MELEVWNWVSPNKYPMTMNRGLETGAVKTGETRTGKVMTGAGPATGREKDKKRAQMTLDASFGP
jgi:hypothetical protein